MTTQLQDWSADVNRVFWQVIGYFGEQIYNHLNGTRVLYWVYLLTSILFAGLIYWRYAFAQRVRSAKPCDRHRNQCEASGLSQSNSGCTLKDFLSFCFPKEIYFHPSATLDFKLFILNNILAPANLRLAWFDASLLAYSISNWLRGTFGDFSEVINDNWWSRIVFTILSAMVFDFAAYFNHALHHQIPILWQIHSLHHSSEVLTPMTIYRSHPLYELNKKLITTAISSPLQGLLIYLFFGEINIITLFDVNFLVALYYTAGHPLVHSHIWLSYGKILNYIFVCPAQHQIHHSSAPQHFNKNYSEFLTIWDWMFDTLYLPEKEEKLEFGIGKDQPQPYPNLSKAYLDPIVNAVRLLRGQVASYAKGDHHEVI